MGACCGNGFICFQAAPRCTALPLTDAYMKSEVVSDNLHTLPLTVVCVSEAHPHVLCCSLGGWHAYADLPTCIQPALYKADCLKHGYVKLTWHPLVF